MTVLQGDIQIIREPFHWRVSRDGEEWLITFYEPDAVASVDWEPGHWSKDGKRWRRGRVRALCSIPIYDVRASTDTRLRIVLRGEIGLKDTQKVIALLEQEEPPESDGPLAPVVPLLSTNGNGTSRAGD